VAEEIVVLVKVLVGVLFGPGFLLLVVFELGSIRAGVILLGRRVGELAVLLVIVVSDELVGLSGEGRTLVSSVNFFCASASSLFTSGWYCFASS
jgi:hypothetical protein